MTVDPTLVSSCVVHSIPTVYSRRQLIGLRRTAVCKSTCYVNDIAAHGHGLLRYRGRRGGAVARSRRARAFVYQHVNTTLIVHWVALAKCTVVVRRIVCHRELNEMSVSSSLLSCLTRSSCDH